MSMAFDDDLRRRAEARVSAKLAFRSHLLAYLVVNAGLLALNLVTSPHYLWSLWPMFGWGIGLIAHGVGVYGDVAIDRERMVAAEMERLRRRGAG